MYLIHGHPEHDGAHRVTDVADLGGVRDVGDVVQSRRDVKLAHLVEAEAPEAGVVDCQVDVGPENER